jgi:regulator of replication initiation timing
MKMHPISCRAGLRAPSLPAALLTVLLATLLMGVAIAGPSVEPSVGASGGPPVDPSCESVKDPHPSHVCERGRGGVTFEVDGEELSVTHHKGDHVSTTVIDLDQIGRLVGDAVGEAKVAMEDLQLQVRLGQDNRVNITTAEDQFEVDLDQIMTQVAAAVRSGLGDIDTATWTSTDSGTAVSDEDLRLELAELQEEMRALRLELGRLRDPAGSAPAVGR